MANLLNDFIAAREERLAAKAEAIETAKAFLFESMEPRNDAADKMKASEESEAQAGIRLYTARCKALLTADEVSALLGQVYGFKVTDKGKVSKTPNGRGEDIRKRVVRLYGAAAFVNGDADNAGKYYEDCRPIAENLLNIVARIDSGELPFWAAYEEIAEAKKTMAASVDMAFDPAKIAKLAQAIGSDEAKATIFASPALKTAYLAIAAIVATW